MLHATAHFLLRGNPAREEARVVLEARLGHGEALDMDALVSHRLLVRHDADADGVGEAAEEKLAALGPETIITVDVAKPKNAWVHLRTQRAGLRRRAQRRRSASGARLLSEIIFGADGIDTDDEGF